MNFDKRFVSMALFVTLLSACVESQKPESTTASSQLADRVLSNAAIYTVDANRSWAEAVAIRDGNIIFVGADDGVSTFIGEYTDVVDLKGRMLLPGFHDSHVHLLIGVATDKECDLLRVHTLEGIAKTLDQCTKLEGFGDERWIIGSGWTEWLWPEAYPHKENLDARFPDRPVYLLSSFGHSAWVNSRALELAGIDDDTPNPVDGVIERDPETGEAVGTLRDGAMMMIMDILPEMTMKYRMDSVRAAIAEAHRFGITAVIEPGLDADMIEPVVALADVGDLKLRTRVSLSPIAWHPGSFDDGIYDLLAQRASWRRPNLDVDSIKIYMDGVIESGTGALLEPYHSGDSGLGPRFYSQEKVNEYMTRFDSMGLQVHVHAGGDAGIRMALDGFEAVLKANGEFSNRHQIVHLQLIDQTDIRRFGELGVSATFQSLWAYPEPSVEDLAVPLLGEERAYRMYPIGSVHRSSGRIVGGSDFFVTDMNPLQAIEVAVTRQDPYTNGGSVLHEKERVDLATMIEAYTINGAYMMELEDRQGSIEVGKRADLVVLDRNLFDIPAYEINEAQVLMTLFNGEVVYQADSK
jgi:predicted amidohydrolase YtcJ